MTPRSPTQLQRVLTIIRKGQTATHWTEIRGETSQSPSLRRYSGYMQGLQQLLVVSRDFSPNIISCPHPPALKLDIFQAQSRNDRGEQLKPLWLAKSWQANLFTFTELFHLEGSPFSSITGTALALKKESCGNPPFSKSNCPLPPKQIKHDITKGFSPAHVQANRVSVNPQITWLIFPAKLDWPKKFKRKGGKDTLVL